MTAGYDIESLQNPQIKHLLRLRENRERKRSGETRIDGGRELLRALEGGAEALAVYHCPPRLRGDDAPKALEAARRSGCRLLTISEAVYDKLRYGDRDEGICATLRWSARSWPTFLQTHALDLVLLIDGVEKPGNLGALLRTADAVGVDAVICVDPACEIDGPNVIRASMGTLFALPVYQCSLEDALRWQRDCGLQTILARPQASRCYFEVDLSRPTLVVMGSEHRGLRPQWDAIDATAVHLPMNGVSDSLNLSVATAVLLYEALRQRNPT